jgi:DNA-binding Lrp family transcriptional regulator
MTLKTMRPEEIKILWALQENPLATIQELAKKSRLQMGKAQYALKRLKEDRGLIVRPFINFLASGAHYVAVYTNLNAPGAKARETLLKSLCQEKSVGWCGELIGDYELAFTICCSHLKEIAALLQRVTEATRVEFTEYVLSPRTDFSLFKRKFITRDQVKTTSLNATYLNKAVFLDALDHKILKTLADAKFDSMREVARLIDEPVSTVDRRIRDLRDKEVITGDFVDLAPIHLGVQPYRLLMRTRGLSRSSRAKLREFSCLHRRVIFIVETLGIYDFEVGLELSEPQMIMEVISDFNEHFGGHIHTMRSLMETRVVKWSNYQDMS